MKMRPLLFLLLLLPLSALAQTKAGRLLTGRVIDAETGEPLPYVAVYIGGGHGTLTNSEGYFHVDPNAVEGMLALSYIGYEKQQVAVSALPAIIRMKPMQMVLREVVVTPDEVNDILRRVIQHIERDYKKRKKETKGYFVRHLIRNTSDSYLIEGFLRARAAVNLREETMLSGIGGRNEAGEESNLRLRRTNLQRVTEVGARTFQSIFWAETVQPLSSLRTVRRYYRTKLETLHSEDGTRLYRIDFVWRNRKSETLARRRYITGRLFVDASTCRPLSFDGVVNNAYQYVDFVRRPTLIKFHLGYDYSDGYAAVSTLSVSGGNELMKYNILLFNVPDADLPSNKQVATTANTLVDIEEAGYDSTLWQRFDIVKRTQEEEEALRKMVGGED